MDKQYVKHLEEINDYITSSAKDFFLLRMGLRTNGDLHLGNIIPVITSFIIARKILKNGRKCKIILSLVDLEDDKENIPFILQRDSIGCHENLVEHSIELIDSFIQDLKRFFDVEISLERVSSIIKRERFLSLIRDCMTFGKKNIKVVCEGCGRINANWESNSDLDNVYFKCEKCGNLNEKDFYSTTYAISHDLLGVIENVYYSPDIHIIGGDHEVSKEGNISSFELREKYFERLGNSLVDRTFVTPLITSDGKNKMSKSSGKGIFLSDIKQEKGSDYCNYLVDMTLKMIDG